MQMLYACPNVKTTTHGAKLNMPPMKAFRAPGFVEGTFGLECLLDELAAKLDLDPLELRRRNHADAEPGGDRPYSSKNLASATAAPSRTGSAGTRCARARPTTVKRGVGMASQVWYGGGGPPSYAWVRVGSDGRATVITAMQDVGTGTKTALAQIAAEELGLPLEHVTVARRRLAARAVRDALRRLVDDAVDGPGRPRRGGRREAADPRARRAALRREDRLASRRQVVSPTAALAARRVLGLLGNGQILGTGARGPNPTGMNVLTFGVQVAEVAVDVETGEVTVDRIAAIHDIGRVINPLGASSQVEGGIIQGIGHTLSEERLHRSRAAARSSRGRSTPTGCRRSPTCRRSSASCRRARRAADEPRREGHRRAADHAGRRRDRERDPRRDGRRRPLAADHARGDAARARARRGEGTGARGARGEPSSLDELDGCRTAC